MNRHELRKLDRALERLASPPRRRRKVFTLAPLVLGLALLLLHKGPGGDATVTVCHTGTKDPAALAREADILIAAVGRPEQVRADWIKPGAVVIDVGIHRRDDGTLCGDVHFPGASEVASWISPVPGGVGAMTVAMLLQNTLRAARLVQSPSK